MVSSMTGYGSFRGEIDGYAVSVELKSVNHRYFEFNAHMSRSLSFLEDKLRTLISQRAVRGKIDCNITLARVDGADECVVVNNELARQYWDAADSLAASLSVSGINSVSELARFPDVFTVEHAETDEQAVLSVVTKAVSQALDSFTAMRAAEGQRLKDDILSRGEIIRGHVEFIEQRSEQTVAEYTHKLFTRLKAVLEDTNVDEQRILTEAAVFADKTAVAEETVRLRSHLEQMHSLVQADEPAGKKLDFLVQEMNREANTIGSKAQDINTTKRVIEIKAEIEKIREQVQNIE